MEKLQIYSKNFKLVFFIIIITEILSFWAYNIEIINQIFFIIIVLTTLFVSLKNLSWGFWIATTELIIGSFGQLFSFEVFNFSISIRLGIFLALVLAYFINFLKTKNLDFRKTIFWKYFLLLFSYLIVGFLLGLNSGNPFNDVFFDFNGFLYFGLIFIAFTVIKEWKQINLFFQILFASVIAMTVKTLFLVFFFSHVTDESLITLIYKWIRDTRIGEIAQILDNYYRIFFQSHIWAVVAFIIIAIYLVYMKKKDVKKIDYIWAWIILIASSINIIISFSRSYWLALFISVFLFYIYLFFKEKSGYKKLIKISSIFLLIIIIDLLIVTAVVNVKIPSLKSGSSVSVAALIKNRVSDTNEAAVTSRYELLSPLVNKFLSNPVFGSGFGTRVSYETNDPRSKGLFSTYAFEWGYLDLLVKIGLLGLIIYLLFIYKIFRSGIKALNNSITLDSYVIILGLLFSLIMLLTTHITTPYLNHPLGIFLLIISSAIFFTFKKNSTYKITST